MNPRIGTICYETGVYCILNTVNNKRYVGSSSLSVLKRIGRHRRLLRDRSHPNNHLQAAWIKYGENSFEFYVLYLCPPKDCLRLEQIWIDVYRSYDNELGYNNSPTAGSSRGTVLGEETRKKMSVASTGRYHTEETKARMSRVQTELGDNNKTPEHRAKLRAAWVNRRKNGPTEKEIAGYVKTATANRGKKRNATTLAKMSKAQSGLPKSQSCKEKISRALTGKKLSKEHKLNISKGLKKQEGIV